ncbi:MAG: SpoIIE family protein phosphatase [Labilithrix sp.]|nr:SpoIIE family protein phosphatase [Labilithrix sp.]MBX3221824.1 SpoIIE family protein phosphatase [Labilithrix sp.]
MVGVEGKARKVRLPINTPLLVGRGASNHIVLDDPRISRQHARFAPERDGPVLYDLNSANGTIVNGVAVSKHKLVPDDVIRFGRYVFRIEEQPAAAEPEVETPTLIATESVARMLVARESAGSGERPLVDLTQLEDAYRKLGTLYAFMQAISSTIDKGELLRLIGGKLREIYPTARAVGIYLRKGSAEGAAAFQLAHFAGTGMVSDVEPTVPHDVADAMLHTARGVFGGDAPESSRVPGGTDMFAPMVDRGAVLGVIHVAADEKRPSFTPADLDLLSGMAAPAAMMIQNTRMHDETILRDRLKYDLELAAKIQKSFLPREVISVEGLELFAEYRAAYTVGGDFYDVFWVGEDRLAVFIGDISGKGVAAALLMARISSELRVAALAHVEPVTVLSAMNEAILASDQPELFFTAIYFTFDVKTGEVVLANAGHPSPYWCHSTGPIDAVQAGASSAIGILDDPGFTATSFHLMPGDSLVLYTDGVVEAADAHGGLYGSTRLEACLHTLTSTRPNEIAERILQSVEAHAIDTAVSDDLTLFICHRAVGREASLQPRRRSGQMVSPSVIPPRSPA